MTAYRCPFCVHPITLREVRADPAAEFVVSVFTEVRRGWLAADACDPKEPLAHRACRDEWLRKRSPPAG